MDRGLNLFERFCLAETEDNPDQPQSIVSTHLIMIGKANLKFGTTNHTIAKCLQ
jgi:hypothetical protein